MDTICAANSPDTGFHVCHQRQREALARHIKRYRCPCEPPCVKTLSPPSSRSTRPSRRFLPSRVFMGESIGWSFPLAARLFVSEAELLCHRRLKQTARGFCAGFGQLALRTSPLFRRAYLPRDGNNRIDIIHARPPPSLRTKVCSRVVRYLSRSAFDHAEEHNVA